MEISFAPGLTAILEAATHGQLLLALHMSDSSAYIVLSSIAVEGSAIFPAGIEGAFGNSSRFLI